MKTEEEIRIELGRKMKVLANIRRAIQKETDETTKRAMNFDMQCYLVEINQLNWVLNQE